ncbi:multidrug resistance-associated ABC transporter [Auriculariales sp. MPI-PUGE-AT-0066]|nr:multidrug resistance-associated ABC transporter [Auriculariales sp. MPI-PUGE-AT-0066]
MPPHQLALALTVLGAAAVSATIRWTSRRQHGQIMLKDDDEELTSKNDPFYFATAEDKADGILLDEDVFWRKMRARKLCLCIILITNIGVLVAALVMRAGAENLSHKAFALGVRILFTAYCLTISVLWVAEDTIDKHWSTTIQLASLVSLEFSLLVFTSVLPGQGTASPLSTTLLRYLSLALNGVVSIICITTPRGPHVHFPTSRIVSDDKATGQLENNVSGYANASILSRVMFSWVTPVVWLGHISETFEIKDLPIVTAEVRATRIFQSTRHALRTIQLPRWFQPKHGSGWTLLYRLAILNKRMFGIEFALTAVLAAALYLQPFFIERLVRLLERRDAGEAPDLAWGWMYCLGLFAGTAVIYVLMGQVWHVTESVLETQMRTQLNTVLFAKTLVRKDAASTARSGASSSEDGAANDDDDEDGLEEDSGFSSKQQVMTLMTTDVNRLCEIGSELFAVIDFPSEVTVGSFFLYKLLGTSAFVGLAVTCLFLPLNRYASKAVVKTQENLMKARDERVALMNELLSGIRMLKFMAWERNFQKRVMRIRDKELKYQRRNYIIETIFSVIWEGSPLLVTLAVFFHYAVIRGMPLTASVAFPALAVFDEIRWAFNTLPETIVNLAQSLVSAKRIEQYLDLPEVDPVAPLEEQDLAVGFNSANIAWPQNISNPIPRSSNAATPGNRFLLLDLNLQFPLGKLSLICGKIGSGKSLLLQSLLGEADVLTGQVLCPRSPPNSLSTTSHTPTPFTSEWVEPGACAFVPQVAWLQNASIRDNIIFHLPFDQTRYDQTLEACALVSDLEIFEDGDLTEIGERGITLSGGQKARVSLARAIYSRASVILLDDVLSAVDAQTAGHLFERCLTGALTRGRTVILVSHHVRLCSPAASYVVALDNGRVAFQGSSHTFMGSTVMASLVQSTHVSKDISIADEPTVNSVEQLIQETAHGNSGELADVSSPIEVLDASAVVKAVQATPKKLIGEERREVGRVGRAVWSWYIKSCGGLLFYFVFILSMLAASILPVAENGWIRIWSRSSEVDGSRSPMFYVAIYAAIACSGVVLKTWRWFVLYYGSLQASRTLYERLLEQVIFAKMRFHDTINRGRLLNRFGSDFESIDSVLSDQLGNMLICALSVVVTLCAVIYVGGIAACGATALLGVAYWWIGSIYGQTSRDLRRLHSVARSPLYSMYGETIAGVSVIRAFGASSRFLQDMLQSVHTLNHPYYWLSSINRWLATRFNMVSSVVVGIAGAIILLNPSIDASLAGFALAFATSLTNDVMGLVRRTVQLEQSMVAVERVKEFTEIEREPPEFVEPRPPAAWPQHGKIVVQNLSVRYAPDLPDVLHELSFTVYPGERVGVLGRTGSGKSTLALALFRMVVARDGRIMIDGLDVIKDMGLTDLRSRLTIIPQDPMIMSGTLRSTLDIFGEYDDSELYEALRRVHLVPSDHDVQQTEIDDQNVFRNLDSPVSEAGENFSSGQKQLICMARAILKRSKILLMDEATASVDYATDELIGKTIREEFAGSTIITVAHRLRTIIDYDKVLLLDHGYILLSTVGCTDTEFRRIAEYEKPSKLLQDPKSKFYALCQATGKEEFEALTSMARALS